MFAPSSQVFTESIYRVKEISSRRHSKKCFAMIFVYLTSLTRKVLHKAVARDDCQN